MGWLESGLIPAVPGWWEGTEHVSRPRWEHAGSELFCFQQAWQLASSQFSSLVLHCFHSSWTNKCLWYLVLRESGFFPKDCTGLNHKGSRILYQVRMVRDLLWDSMSSSVHLKWMLRKKKHTLISNASYPIYTSLFGPLFPWSVLCNLISFRLCLLIPRSDQTQRCWIPAPLNSRL